jgi:DNA repair exonuclease SbcCD nuclease subunit
MIKILHTADLHLKRGDERDYCFAVLDAVIALAKAEKPAYLLIAGDLFDSFEDFKELRAETAARFKELKGVCEIIYIPGNHENLRRTGPLESFDLGDVKKFTAHPFEIYYGEGVEFVCVPHAESYGDYRDWAMPPKDPASARVLVMHGLNSRIYTGPEEEAEGKAGVIDDGLFARFDTEYAALGHVHGARQERFGNTLAAYPGSPRVWRGSSREEGPRGVYRRIRGASRSRAVPPLRDPAGS